MRSSEEWKVSDFIAAFSMLLPFYGRVYVWVYSVCMLNIILYPNSVILITSDTYKLRLSECVYEFL